MFFGRGGFPFEGFEEMGGRGPAKDVDTQKFYDIIGVPKTATLDEIKKAYKKKAIKLHPDKGGDPEQFKELSVAYEVLSDPQKRDLYDKYGEEGIREGGGGGGGFDIFDMFRGAQQQQRSGPKKAKAVAHAVKATLEDLYNGKTTKVVVTRDRICAKCSGAGGKGVQKCGTCKGRGMVTKMRQLGPGMYTQSTGPCDDCRGQGETVADKDKCKTCNGKKVLSEKKVIECEIAKGSPHQEKYVFHGEADEYPGVEAGDVVIVVQQQPHEVFKRKGADLWMEKTITLQQALTGVDFILQHLDGRKIRIKNTPGEVVKPDEIKTVEGFGMPYHKAIFKFGNLFIQFKIEFPLSVDASQLSLFREALGGETNPQDEIMDVAETCGMVDFSETHKNVHHEGGERGQGGDGDSDEDEEGGRGGVQCRQQ